ncbi:hypothetical protein LSAT2_017957 [Lamellibrachia satsuma]|nr:hypothetical protein LSAT2_017957 [Lamellibrachia satsuma]
MHVRKKVDLARTVSAFLGCTLVAVISLRPRRDQRCTINNGHVYTTGKHTGTNDLDLGTKVQLAGSRLGSGTERTSGLKTPTVLLSESGRRQSRYRCCSVSTNHETATNVLSLAFWQPSQTAVSRLPRDSSPPGPLALQLPDTEMRYFVGIELRPHNTANDRHHRTAIRTDGAKISSEYSTMVDAVDFSNNWISKTYI